MVRQHHARVDLNEADLTFRPVTADQWDDLESLFSEHGIQNGCWCMYWRIPRKECQRHYGEGNKQFLKQLVESGKVPGILAYHDGEPVGWCSVAPREEFPVVLRSPTLKPIDDQPVWSIVCFFVSRPYRESGLTHFLIKAAIQYASDGGAQIIEAYPIDVHEKHIEYERYSGLTTTYEKEGFKVACRRSKRRPIMRYSIERSGAR